MKLYEGMDLWLHAFVTLTLDAGEWSDRPCQLAFAESAPDTHWAPYPVLPLSGIEPRFLGRPAQSLVRLCTYVTEWRNSETTEMKKCFLVWITACPKHFLLRFCVLYSCPPSPHFIWLSIRYCTPETYGFFSPRCDWRSRDSSVGIVIRLWARLRRNHGSIPCRDKILVTGIFIPPGAGNWPLTFIGCWGSNLHTPIRHHGMLLN